MQLEGELVEQHRIMKACDITRKSVWLASRVCYAKEFGHFHSGCPELSNFLNKAIAC